jgi:hypothetical protein
VTADDEAMSEEEEELARINAIGARLEANRDDPKMLAEVVAEGS